VVPELKEFKRYDKTVLTPGMTPSEGAKFTGYRRIQGDVTQAIYDGRRAPTGLISTIAPPIQIFHPIFDDFIHLVNDPDFQPTVDDIKDVQELMYFASEVGRMEEGQRGLNEGLRKRLRRILPVQAEVHVEPNDDGTKADGSTTDACNDNGTFFRPNEVKGGPSNPKANGFFSMSHDKMVIVAVVAQLSFLGFAGNSVVVLVVLVNVVVLVASKRRWGGRRLAIHELEIGCKF